MVSPEGTRPEGSRPQMGRKGLFAVAILIVAVGFVVLGNLTSAEPAAIEETTTSTTSTTLGEILPPIDLENFSVDQLQTGPQFDWERAAIEDAEGYPIGLLSHEGTLYLFATSTPDWRLTDAGGLLAWRSSDGTSWESLGQVIEEDFQVSRVESTPGGLVAAGTSPDQSALIIWTSSDGENWVAEEIPVDEEHPHLDLSVTALGANQEALVVMTNVEFDGQRMLEQRLAEAGYEVDLDYLSWGTSYGVEDGATLTINGPLGLPGIELELEDLELTEEEEHWVRNGYNATPDVSTWTRATESSEWIPGRIVRAQWVESIVTGGDGTMLLTGWLGTGPVRLQSTDGIQWTEPDLDLPSNRVFPWRDGLLAIAETSRPELLYSEDGSDWTELGLGDRFPPPIQWSPLALATGDDGVVLSINGYETANAPTSREPMEIVTEDGHLLILDLEGGVISLDMGDETHTWEVYRAEPAEGIDVDMVGHTVTLDDPDTGEPLAVLSFDELFKAEQDYYTARFLAEEHQAIVFTGDGSEWIIQPTTAGFGDKVWIGDLHVDAGRVFAVTFDREERFDPFTIPELNLWSAEIP